MFDHISHHGGGGGGGEDPRHDKAKLFEAAGATTFFLIASAEVEGLCPDCLLLITLFSIAKTICERNPGTSSAVMLADVVSGGIAAGNKPKG